MYKLKINKHIDYGDDGGIIFLDAIVYTIIDNGNGTADYYATAVNKTENDFEERRKLMSKNIGIGSEKEVAKLLVEKEKDNGNYIVEVVEDKQKLPKPKKSIFKDRSK